MTHPDDPDARMDWQPIETAPKSNGSIAFIAYVPGHGCVVCTRNSAGIIESRSSRRQIWRAAHWRPLPAAPQTAAVPSVFNAGEKP